MNGITEGGRELTSDSLIQKLDSTDTAPYWENEDGKTIYEIETKIKGHTRDMLIDAKGVLTEVEEEINLASLPAAVQAEINKSIGKAKLVKLEAVFNGSKVQTGFSALVELAGEQSEVEMGLNGKKLPPGK